MDIWSIFYNFTSDDLWPHQQLRPENIKVTEELLAIKMQTTGTVVMLHSKLHKIWRSFRKVYCVKKLTTRLVISHGTHEAQRCAQNVAWKRQHKMLDANNLLNTKMQMFEWPKLKSPCAQAVVAAFHDSSMTLSLVPIGCTVSNGDHFVQNFNQNVTSIQTRKK